MLITRVDSDGVAVADGPGIGVAVDGAPGTDVDLGPPGIEVAAGPPEVPLLFAFVLVAAGCVVTLVCPG